LAVEGTAQTPFSTAAFAAAGQAYFNNLLSALAMRADPDAVARLQAPAGPAAALCALQARYQQEHFALWQSALARQAGFDTPAASSAQRGMGDRRFAAAAWRTNPYFDYLRRSYLLNAQFLTEVVETLELEQSARERLRFVTRQFVDAMSPANFAATNPEALELALETRGESLSAGLRNLTGDVEKGRISTSDESVFEVGRNLAATEGAVVYENPLMQLIQYAPRTARQHARPLLMVPPCINKFYILDLQPDNSLARHALEQGHNVFMVSWRNVLAAEGHHTWDDYLESGVIKALEVARDISGADQVNALGFCVGGTLLCSALAVLKGRGEQPAASLTLLAAMLDFSDTGDIGLFVDEASVAAREAAIGSGGIMPGRDLAFIFSALRANDLVWPYVVNGYLKGKSPPAFDLLYWNADSTNLPGPMYCWYLRNAYLENNLRVPGRLSMLGVPVDLGQLDCPAYIVAARDDHIVPWHTAYASTQLLGRDRRGAMRFILGASGHVAGIVNSAIRNKRSYWTATGLPADPQAWLAQAVEHPGSWWRDWSEWLAPLGGEPRQAGKTLGGNRHRPIEAAPGRYVKQRVA